MAIRSITNELVQYVVNDDRDNDNPTVFWVRQLSVRDVMAITARLQNATEERRGQSRVNEAKLFKIMLEHWPKVVAKIDNFQIRPGTVIQGFNGVEEDLYARYKDRALPGDISGDGVVTLNATTDEQLGDILKMIPVEYRQEVVDFAEKASTVGAKEKNS